MKILSSRFGNNLKMQISGGSHESEMVLKIWGLPSNFKWNMNDIMPLLIKRQGGQEYATPRKESDIPEIVSTNPLTIIVKNKDYDSSKYQLNIPRPGHADFTAHIKYKDEINMSGGGPFSGRMTIMMTIAGGIAKLYLSRAKINISAKVESVGGIDFSLAKPLLNEAKQTGDSLGGVCSFNVSNLPIGLGGPMFDGLESSLASCLFGIPGVKGVDFGSGVNAAKLKGSENNDEFILKNNKIKNNDEFKVGNNIATKTNNHGGILGGITSGMPLTGKVYFKPTPSISKEQQSINFETGEPTSIKIQGRHDVCIALRGCAVVEALVAFVILDSYLEYQNQVEPTIDLSRAHIDAIDNEIFNLLTQRIIESKKIGKIKSQEHIPITDKDRERAILENLHSSFPDLPNEVIDDFYAKIFFVSKSHQKQADD